jgi:hypothetical protein
MKLSVPAIYLAVILSSSSSHLINFFLPLNNGDNVLFQIASSAT